MCVCAGEGKKWYVRCLGTLVCLFIVATPASASHSMEGGGNKSKKMYLKCAKKLPFLCWNCQVWSNFTTYEIIFCGKLGARILFSNINASQRLAYCHHCWLLNLTVACEYTMGLIISMNIYWTTWRQLETISTNMNNIILINRKWKQNVQRKLVWLVVHVVRCRAV